MDASFKHQSKTSFPTISVEPVMITLVISQLIKTNANESYLLQQSYYGNNDTTYYALIL